MAVKTESFGNLPDGRTVPLYILENSNGMCAEIAGYGGAIVRLMVPDRKGDLVDVVLGHPSLEGYLSNSAYLGVLVGRNSNRIAGAAVAIDGNVYSLEENDGDNNLHSGPSGLSFRLLSGRTETEKDSACVHLTTSIGHCSDGFPGNLSLDITYTLTNQNELRIYYQGVCDQTTVINPTNHSYFNLAGHSSGPVYNQLLQLESDFYTPLNSRQCPTGEIVSVQNTPMDFRRAKPIGRDIAKTNGGYDDNFLLNGSRLRRVATATDPASGRMMEVHTDLPAMQLYTAGGLGRTCGKEGAVYQPHSGFCLETQFVPNAMQMPWLTSPVIPAGREFQSITAFRFFAE